MSELFGIGTTPAPAGGSDYWTSFKPTTFRLPSGKIRTAGDPNTAAYLRSNMGGVAVDSSMQPKYQLGAPAVQPAPVSRPAAPVTPAAAPAKNTAIVEALRQKPIQRFEGLGMGTGMATNAMNPQAKTTNIANLTSTKTPNGLFHSM